MNKWMLLGVAAVSAVSSGLLLKPAFWDANRAALLVALSVIAAGTLVRLARGLPFTTPDHYELSEIRELTAAVAQIMRKLRLLLLMIIGTMLLLVIAFPLVAFLARRLQLDMSQLDIAASAVLGAMHAYVFARMYQVVLGDENLTALQSKFVERAVARKQGKTFGDPLSNPGSVIASTSNYGKRLG